MKTKNTNVSESFVVGVVRAQCEKEVDSRQGGVQHRPRPVFLGDAKGAPRRYRAVAKPTSAGCTSVLLYWRTSQP